MTDLRDRILPKAAGIRNDKIQVRFDRMTAVPSLVPGYRNAIALRMNWQDYPCWRFMG